MIIARMTGRDSERFDVRDDEPLGDPVPGAPAFCPSCESPNVRRFPRFAFALLALVLVVSFDANFNGGITELTGIGAGTVLLLTILLGGWRCRDCGYAWK